MSASLIFALVTGFLATVSAALLAALLAGLYRWRLTTESALEQVQALKASHPDARVEDYLPIIGRLPASKYSDELHQKLFGTRSRGIDVQASELHQPWSNVKAAMKELHRPSATDHISLTPREVKILELVAKGLTNAQIAQRLSLQENLIQYMLDGLEARLRERRTDSERT